MKKIVLLLLLMSVSPVFTMHLFEVQGIEKGKATSVINAITERIKTLEFVNLEDAHKANWIINDMNTRMQRLLNDKKYTVMGRSTFDKWVNVLQNIAQKAKGKSTFKLKNMDESTTWASRTLAYRECPDYSQRAFQNSAAYKPYLSAVQNSLPALSRGEIDDDATLIEASSERPSPRKPKTLDDGTASSDDSELAGELSSDCTLVEQLKRKDEPSMVSSFLSRYPVLRVTGLGVIILVAYKMYLDHQDPEVMIVDSKNGTVKHIGTHKNP